MKNTTFQGKKIIAGRYQHFCDPCSPSCHQTSTYGKPLKSAEVLYGWYQYEYTCYMLHQQA